MLPTGSEKALRKLVIELATATPEDIAAVLGMLDNRARHMVRALLAAYTDAGDVFEIETPPEAPVAAPAAGLSDWLAARTLGQPRDGDGFRLTPRTAETVRALAAALPPARPLHLDGAGA